MGADQIRQLQRLVKRHPALMWDTQAYDTLDADVIAEAIYNYGSWENVAEYHQILGMKTARGIFERLTNKNRCNLHPKTRYFFQQYYDRHTH